MASVTGRRLRARALLSLPGRAWVRRLRDAALEHIDAASQNDVELIRHLPCTGEDLHWFCKPCLRSYVTARSPGGGGSRRRRGYELDRPWRLFASTPRLLIVRGVLWTSRVESRGY